jgi:hypothetical protein
MNFGMMPLIRTLGILTALGLAGCYVKGREGFVCESSKECDPGLACRTFTGKGQSRNACVPPGTTSIGSKSTYTVFGVYLAWFATLALPVWIGALVVKSKLDDRRSRARP